MFPFSHDSKDPQPEPQTASAPKAAEAHPLDALTGGAFSAATSGERAQRVRDWLATQPSQEQMQEVFKELSTKDKGAAKALRERLDELRRAKNQETVVAEWEAKAQALLQSARLNIADTLAWQRDAAKAGAPLSREPLAGLRARLTARVEQVEDLQQRVMVQREAAMLLAQRIELLSTKPLLEAEAQQPGLDQDVSRWQAQASQLQADPQWPSVDLRYPPQIESAQTQLAAVWDAFNAALAQALAARADASAPLPAQPVWADELRAARDHAKVPAAADKPARPKVDPEQRAAAQKAIEAGVMLLEQAVTAGHTKNMHSATNALRQSLKTHGRLIDDALEARVHAALVSAGELEGWQRWSADKVREQLLARAEALLVKRKIKAAAGAPAQQDVAGPSAPEPVAIEPAADAVGVTESLLAAPEETPADSASQDSTPAAADQQPAAPAPGDAPAPATGDAATDASPGTVPDAPQTDADSAEPAAPALEPGYELMPAMGGRKLQDTIRKLREEWKTADQGGAPNHALWKRFDRALNAAHKFVDEWIAGARAEAAEHRAQREALIDEVNAWAVRHASAGEDGQHADWKTINRQVHQFSERWRNAGHLSEKQFAELQPRWKEAIHAAALPLETAQKQNAARRQALIAEAEALGAAPQLRIDAVRALQQRWQAEAQAVPLERKHEQKLWDAFRKPIDEAFNRKSAEREKQQASMSEHDKAVLEAAKALEAANASGDAQQIRAAMAQLEAATRGQSAAAPQAQPAQAPASADATPPAPDDAAGETPAAEDGDAAAAVPAPAPKPAKPLIAMRGDDRPGAKKAEPAGRPAGKFGDRPGSRPGAPRPGPGGERSSRFGGDRNNSRFGDRPPREDRGPRLGDAAFRAQRDAVENAQVQLRKLAAQAHGEALTQLLGAWQQRQPDQVPSVQELGRRVTPAVRAAWAQAIGGSGSPASKASEALLRLEMAAELPTPAEHLDARRALQLQLLTRRNDPAPAQTWGQDAAAVLATPHDQASARRLQNALKALLGH
ncbi:MAG: DUF349 domain-containing protein [Desulfovibrionaceae bacterium]|nr:DUF349 domain-containing protein [Desulfovibrionaceae bacterium]